MPWQNCVAADVRRLSLKSEIGNLKSEIARASCSENGLGGNARPHPGPLPQERTLRTFIAPCALEPAGVRSARRPGAQRVRMQSAAWGRFRHEQAVGAAATGDRSRSKGGFMGRRERSELLSRLAPLNPPASGARDVPARSGSECNRRLGEGSGTNRLSEPLRPGTGRAPKEGSWVGENAPNFYRALRH